MMRGDAGGVRILRDDLDDRMSTRTGQLAERPTKLMQQY